MPQIQKRFIANNSIDNTKLDQSSSYDFDANNGNIKVKTPLDDSDATNKKYVDELISSFYKQEIRNLIYTDIENKVIELNQIPLEYNEVLLFAYNGKIQKYGTDFTISVKNDTAYICLSPDSTPPLGGAWDIQNLPTIGVLRISDLEYGFLCKYSY